MTSNVRLTIQEELQRLATFSGQSGSGNHVDLVKNNIYTVTLNTLTKQRVGAEWRPLNYLWNHYEKVIREARTGNNHGATQLLREAETYRRQLTTNPLLNQLLDVSALPAVAYLYYKQQRFADAERVLLLSIDSDAQLLNDGFYILAYHRVQQLHNIARLYFKQAQLREGATFIREGLEFMLLGRRPTVGSDWRYQDAEAVPIRLRSDMACQLAGEVITTGSYVPRQERLLFYETFGNLLSWQPATNTEQGLLAWIRATDNFFKGRFDRFLTSSIDFLIGQPTRFDLFKQSLLLSLVDSLSQRGYYSADAKECIRQFTNQLTISPQGQAQLLALPAVERLSTTSVPQAA